MRSGRRALLGLGFVALLAGLIMAGIINESNRYNMADQFYMGNGQYDVFAAANYVMDKSFEECSGVITKKDVNEAMKTVSRQMSYTMGLSERVLAEAENDGLTDVFKDIAENVEIPQSEVSSFDWLLDYNNDGVKDMLDYNIWNYIQNGYE